MNANLGCNLTGRVVTPGRQFQGVVPAEKKSTHFSDNSGKCSQQTCYTATTGSGVEDVTAFQTHSFYFGFLGK